MNTVKEFFSKIFGRKKDNLVTVSQALAGLPEEYTVFSSVLYGNSEISHVVFSRGQGVFLINSFAGKGEITFNGSTLVINRKPKSEAIQKSLKDTFWLKSTIREEIGIDAHIIPLAVYENAKVRLGEPVIGVRVIESAGLSETILNTPERKPLEDGILMVLRELHGTLTLKSRGI